MAKAQDADPVGDTLGAGKARKLAVQRGLELGLLHGQVTQAEPLLQEMNAQHRHQLERRASGLGPRCVRRNQRQQLRPRHHHVHLVEKHGFARAPRVQDQSEVLLGHAVRA